MALSAPTTVSYAEYLAVEALSEQKREFHDGVVVAMSGGTPEHSYLAARAVFLLTRALEGGRCRTFESNLRLYLASVRRGLYPDASVVCARLEHAPADPDGATNPTVIVEVLSPSTEAYDRGEKFELYQTLPSLQEYLLIASQRLRVEVIRREADGTWRHAYYGSGDTVVLRSIDARFDVDALYHGWAELVARAPETG